MPTLNAPLDEMVKSSPTDYTDDIRKVLDFIRAQEESYRLVANASDLSVFAAKLKSIFSGRMLALPPPCGLSENPEKRAVQIYFLISACVDTVIRYLRGGLGASLDIRSER